VNWRNLTQPDQEPVTLSEAKAHLKVDFSDDDALITSLIKAARAHAEKIQGRAFISRVVRATIDVVPEREIVLPLSPVIDVRSITFYDTSNAAHLVPSTDYLVDRDAWDGRIILNDGSDWPEIDARAAKTVVIEYDAGCGSAPEDVSEDVKAAMKLMIGHWYTHREDTNQGQQVYEIPMASRALLGMDRAVNL
jgi:uncharacterized phiE125 gp8 family phage protein